MLQQGLPEGEVPMSPPAIGFKELHASDNVAEHYETFPAAIRDGAVSTFENKEESLFQNHNFHSLWLSALGRTHCMPSASWGVNQTAQQKCLHVPAGSCMSLALAEQLQTKDGDERQ